MAIDKIALVTGAGTGVGRAAALALMKAGFTVVLAGRRKDKLDETQKLGEAHGKSLPVSADMKDPHRSPRCSPRSRTVSAGSTCCSTMPAWARRRCRSRISRVEQWKAVVDTNLTAPFLCTQHAFRIMKDQNAARRPHHQQRLDLGARAAPALGRLHLDQARHHRPDQIHHARRPRL